MSKTISARIDDTLHTMITDEANQKGKTVNESLKEMLNNHFNGEEKEEGRGSPLADYFCGPDHPLVLFFCLSFPLQ